MGWVGEESADSAGVCGQVVEVVFFEIEGEGEEAEEVACEGEDLSVVVGHGEFEAGELRFGWPDVSFAFGGVRGGAVEFDVFAVAARGVEGGFVAPVEAFFGFGGGTDGCFVERCVRVVRVGVSVVAWFVATEERGVFDVHGVLLLGGLFVEVAVGLPENAVHGGSGDAVVGYLKEAGGQACLTNVRCNLLACFEGTGERG